MKDYKSKSLSKKSKKNTILLYCLCLTFFIILSGCSPSLNDLSFLYKKTTAHYEDLLNKNPDNLELRLKLVKFYYRFNDHGKIKDLLADMPDKESRIILAKSLNKLGDHTHALEIFNQLQEIEDNEYLYLYAQTCEKKNLFPQAVDLYAKVGPPFRELAQIRIKEIGLKIEEGMPPHIKKILDEENEFLSSIDEDEAVMLLVDETIRVSKENTVTSSVHVIEKVLKEKGKNAGEVKIGYDSTYERVELEYARTITPDGKIVYAGKENIRDVSKYLNFPLYSNAHVFIISMPSVEVGSIIEYKLKIYSSKLIDKDNFTFIYRLKELTPIARANFKLLFPKEKNVSLRFLNKEYSDSFNLAPSDTEENDNKVYSWKFKHIPAIIPEEKMPPFSEINPAMIISSFDSWKEVYEWWHDLFKDKIILPAEIKSFLKKLIKDCPSDLEKAKKIYDFCARDIRYVGVEYGESGYEPHKAEDVFWNRYGDCKDKATLLVAMMKEAGISAFPVLIPTQDVYPIDESQPSVNFNHAIAAIKLNEELIFVDATASTVSFGDLPLGDQERKVLVFFDNNYKIMTTPVIKDNEVIYQTNIKIDNNEDALLEREIIAKGFFASVQRYYFENSHPQKIKEDIQERIVEISPFSKLIDYQIIDEDDFDKFPILRYNFQTKKLLNPAKDLRILPFIGDIELDVGYVGREARSYPIDFRGVFKRTSNIRIDLPYNLEAKYIPEDKFIQTKWFDFASKCTKKGKSLNFHREFAIKTRLVPKDDYEELKEQLEKVFYILKEETILEQK